MCQKSTFISDKLSRNFQPWVCQLFEAVGNGDLRHGGHAFPCMRRVTQLIANGATVDHFIPSDYNEGIFNEGNVNAIDMVMLNKTHAAFDVLKVGTSQFGLNFDPC